MKCDNCPAAWESSTNNENGYECDCYGCLIMGRYYGGEGESCSLTSTEVKNRLYDLKRYEKGEIVRPQWVANRFIREMDGQMGVECGYPGFPPKRMPKTVHYDECGEEYYGVYKYIYGSTDSYYERCHAYKDGYEDAKAGKECDPHSHYGEQKKKHTLDEIFE